jgi:hypothetical protein
MIKSFLALVSKPGLATEPAGPVASTAYIVPVTCAAVTPAVILLPAAGLNPTSPVIAEMGTLVIPVPARTTKGSAAPRVGEVAASGRADTLNDSPANVRAIIRMSEIVINFRLCILIGLLRQNLYQWMQDL